jgi:hypothetical protein
MNAITVFFLSGIVGRLMGMIKWQLGDGSMINVKDYLFQIFFLSWFNQ